MLKISLEAARVNVGLTQKEAAKCLKVSNKTLHNWETGKTSPSAEHIDNICVLYRVSYNDLNFLPNDSLKGNLAIIC